MSIAATPPACGLKSVLIGAPETESHTTMSESAPASAVTSQRLSAETTAHAIGLQWPWSKRCVRVAQS